MRLFSVATFVVVLATLLTGCSSSVVETPTAPAKTNASAAPSSTVPPASTGAPSPAEARTPTASGAPTELTVFAAASLTESFGIIAQNFQAANPGVKVTYSFGGSNDLAAQIDQGAPADVFASANDAQMSVVVKAGQVAPDAPRPFVRNRLIVITPKSNPARIATLRDLGKPGVKVVLAAKEVPVGQYALAFLDKAGKDPSYGPAYKDAVLKNVVSYEQDVKAVLNKIVLGEADAGIVYTTDVTPVAASLVGRIAIPDALNTIATYPIAPLAHSPHAALAQAFVAYVLSNEGQTVLAKFGFIPANATARLSLGRTAVVDGRDFQERLSGAGRG